VATALTEEPGPPIRLLIVDDHPVVRDGTAALLTAQPGIEVAGTAGSIDEALALIASVPADVLLLDIRLGTDSGLRLLTETSDDAPAIIVLTAYDYPQYAEAALRLGASGFVLKTAPLAELLDAIRRVAAGGMAFSIRPRTGGGLTRLSERELDVVRLVVDGRSNDEIGARLGIGPKTVESHLRRLFERFDLASRTELATRALREGWLEVPPGA
jgi:two-component system, NarL family, nitrate/nitrite response regulator NarL